MTSFISPKLSIAALSVMVTLGVMVHDTTIDKAAIHLLTLPAILASGYLGGETLKVGNEQQHTHVERAAFGQAMKEINGDQPRIKPRSTDRKYLSEKRVPKGTDVADGYYIPVA